MTAIDFVGLSVIKPLLELVVLLKTPAPLMAKSTRLSCAETTPANASTVAMASPAVLISFLSHDGTGTSGHFGSAPGQAIPATYHFSYLGASAELIQPNRFCLLYRRNPTKFADHLFWHAAVHMHDRNGLLWNPSLYFAPPQRKIRDVDSVLAKNRPHLADDPRHVLIAHVNQVFSEGRFDVNSIHVQ